MSGNRAPVVIFSYNRIDKLEELLISLSSCILSNETELFIFQDLNIELDYIYQNIFMEKYNYKFQNITFINRPVHMGLKMNIITGVDQIFQSYNNLIVFEDDLICHKQCLIYFNYLLEYYENNSNIWHINGWSPLMKSNFDLIKSKYVYSWGWATWKEKWEKISFDLNLNSYNVWSRINVKFWLFLHHDKKQTWKDNKNNRITTWAIFWQICILSNGGYSLTPTNTLLLNNGLINGTNHKRTSLKDRFYPKAFHDIVFDVSKSTCLNYRNIYLLFFELFTSNRFFRLIKLIINWKM